MGEHLVRKNQEVQIRILPVLMKVFDSLRGSKAYLTEDITVILCIWLLQLAILNSRITVRKPYNIKITCDGLKLGSRMGVGTSVAQNPMLLGLSLYASLVYANANVAQCPSGLWCSPAKGVMGEILSDCSNQSCAGQDNILQKSCQSFKKKLNDQRV